MSAGQDDARQRSRLARTHLHGFVCARDEQYAEAEESCLNAIEIDPKEVGPYVTLASVYVCGRQYRKMLGVLRRAVGVDAVALRPRRVSGDGQSADCVPKKSQPLKGGRRCRGDIARTPCCGDVTHRIGRGQGGGIGAGDSAAAEP